MRFSLKDAGFTLVEVMISMLLMGAVVVMLAETSKTFDKGTQDQKLQNVRVTDKGSFLASFQKVVDSGAIAGKYEHLPIPAYCAADYTKPCLATQNAVGVFQPLASPPTGLMSGGSYVNSVEFFRDEDAALTTVKPYSVAVDGSQVARVQRSTAIQLPSTVTTTPHYATWPLINSYSPPFPIIRTIKSGIYLSFDWGGTPQMSQNPPTDRVVRFKSAQGALSAGKLDTLNNGLLLIYNADDPRQYIVQYVSSVSANAGGPDLYDLVLDPVSNSTMPVNSSNRYFGDFYSVYSGVANASALLWGGSSGMYPTYYGLQNSQFYLFPTQVHALSTTSYPSSPSPFDFNPSGYSDTGVDLRRVAYYYNTVTQKQPVLIAVPIQITSYFLRDATAPLGCPDYATTPASAIPKECPKSAVTSLIQKTYPPGLELEVMRNIESTEMVVFSRQLGSSGVSVQFSRYPQPQPTPTPTGTPQGG